MPRATIIATVDEPKERAAVNAWFEKWTARLTHLSDDYGCGCCVNIWNVEGPEEAIAEIPPSTDSESEWASSQ